MCLDLRKGESTFSAPGEANKQVAVSRQHSAFGPSLRSGTPTGKNLEPPLKQINKLAPDRYQVPLFEGGYAPVRTLRAARTRSSAPISMADSSMSNFALWCAGAGDHSGRADPTKA